MKEVKRALSQGRSGYPVLNTAGRLVGLIPTHMLITLYQKRFFYDKDLIYPITRQDQEFQLGLEAQEEQKVQEEEKVEDDQETNLNIMGGAGSKPANDLIDTDAAPVKVDDVEFKHCNTDRKLLTDT